ncbi:MAG: hypothetical protein Q9202_003273 [Teloschistes flavicans]
MATSNQPRLVLDLQPPAIHINRTSAFKSQVFAILAGSSQEVFYAHATVLAKSVVLQRLVEGQFKESNEQRIIWPYWNANAVANFLEWLYTGDYQCPYPMIIPRPMLDEKTPPEDVLNSDCALVEEEKQDNSNRDGKRSTQVPPENSSQSRPTRLRDLEWNGSLCPTRISSEDEYSKWIGHAHYQTNELDYERNFMTHAELYAMGCQYLLDDLRALSWQRLKNALVAVGIPFVGSTLITNVTNVIHYVFQQTGDLADGKEQMRELLTTFATDHFKQMKGAPAFDELLKSPLASDREFVVDLMAKIGAKLDEKDELLQEAEERQTKLLRNAEARNAMLLQDAKARNTMQLHKAEERRAKEERMAKQSPGPVFGGGYQSDAVAGSVFANLRSLS